MREEVEALEDDAEPAPRCIGAAIFKRHPLAFNADLTGVNRLKEIGAAEQRGLARARCADQADHFMFGE